MPAAARGDATTAYAGLGPLDRQRGAGITGSRECMTTRDEEAAAASSACSSSCCRCCRRHRRR
uniref:Uncharacterized protein n=1 Tax=Oryza rufipogon TaxID=4529 RepID=A0A0E0P0Q3_ORYRU